MCVCLYMCVCKERAMLTLAETILLTGCKTSSIYLSDTDTDSPHSHTHGLMRKCTHTQYKKKYRKPVHSGDIFRKHGGQFKYRYLDRHFILKCMGLHAS